ncbi:MAG: hypothetical protein OCU12_06290 [Methanophagales archaeon]|nr:hypothetical protein [Methanophagales archaeon]
MKLTKIFYSESAYFTSGWWAEIEGDAGTITAHFLWPDYDRQPNWDDLSDLVGAVDDSFPLSLALAIARVDDRLVRREG